jgi:hypothetical protein
LISLHPGSFDMDGAIDPSPDGRTVSVTVLANDAGERGERPPVEAADVQVISHTLRSASRDARLES